MDVVLRGLRFSTQGLGLAMPSNVKGTIVNISRNRIRMAVSTTHGISLVELRKRFDGVLRMGDDMEGPLETLDTQQVESTRGPLEIFVVDIARTEQAAAQWVWAQ